MCLGWLEAASIYVFAKRCEDYFHGKSSGVDIRGVLSDQGVFVAANGAVSPVHLRWQPCVYLVDTGCVGITAAAVSRVMALQSEPWAHAVDQDMICSVTSMQKALQSSSGSCAVLADAMRLAQSCFARWGLVPPSVEALIRSLFLHGAQAVKLTGSGDGGFLLALFAHDKPAIAQRERWLPLFTAGTHVIEGGV